MLLLSALALGGAIALYHLTYKITDDVMQLAGMTTSLFCLLLSVIFAPWPIQLLSLVVLLLLLNYSCRLVN